jgi:hypothetical protein
MRASIVRHRKVVPGPFPGGDAWDPFRFAAGPPEMPCFLFGKNLFYSVGNHEISILLPERKARKLRFFSKKQS